MQVLNCPAGLLLPPNDHPARPDQSDRPDHRQVAMDGGSVAYRNSTRSKRDAGLPINGLPPSSPGDGGTGVGLSEARLELGPEEDGPSDGLGGKNPAFSDIEDRLGEDRAGVGIVRPPAETVEQTNKAQFSTRL